MKNLTPEDQQSALAAAKFSHLYNIVRSLRGPQGCPWDKEQTILTLRNSLIEEAYEALEAINETDHDHVKEELGDVILVVMLMAYIEEQDGNFSVSEMISTLSEKLVRRHPHVFGEEQIEDSDEVLIQWDKIKAVTEKRGMPSSVLDSVSKSLPTLDRAFKLQKKAAKSGFDWEDYHGVIEKIREELDEVEDEITQLEENGIDPYDIPESEKEHLEEEIGDLLFSAVNLARKHGIHPNEALSRTNSKFYQRFSHVEKRMKESGLEMTSSALDQMEEFWNEAKVGKS